MRARICVVLCAAAVAFAAAPAQAAGPYDQLSRKAFNRLAVRENLSLFWIADTDADGTVDPDEITPLLFYPPAPTWTDGAEFTADFDSAYARLLEARSAKPRGHRLALVAKDLDQGTPTLIGNDLSGLPDTEKAFVGHMLRVAKLIDALFDRTTGAAALASRVSADTLDQSLFRRNRGPACMAPDTKDKPGCSAIPGAPEPRVDLYPRALQKRDGFCKRLEKRPDAKQLLGPFTVMRRARHGLKAVPYSAAYRRQMTAIAVELDAAAATATGPQDGPLVRYLHASARGFRTNRWGPADEAWSRMNAKNSDWYVRVGPDEVYTDPCQHKGAFHLTFARINPRSVKLQRQLSPLRGLMERAFAEQAGPPYKARKVAFHLPDFIDIVLNAGDDRFAFGITTGQSLPNWGKVARENRGRTVVMSNVDGDADSSARRQRKAESLFAASAVKHFTNDSELELLTTILHEASHNLGPTGQYRVRGKTDAEIFGGATASVLEEAKAESGGLFLVDLLRRHGIIDDATAVHTYYEQLLYAFTQLPYGKQDAYAELSAIEIGFLIDRGAIEWRKSQRAANGTDRGAFVVHTAKLVPAFDALIARVAGIKARGDRAAARHLLKRYVHGSVVPWTVIVKRLQRFPQGSYVYALTL